MWTYEKVHQTLRRICSTQLEMIKSTSRFDSVVSMVSGRRLALLRLLFVFCLIGFVVKYKMFACSDEFSRKLIQKTCTSYLNGKVSGNMCQALCSEQIEFTGCYKMKYDWGAVARQVYSAQFQGRKVWIKSKPYEFSDKRIINTSLSLPELVKLTQDFVSAQLGAPGINEQGVELVKKMWPQADGYWNSLQNGGRIEVRDVQTLWSLLQQKEYVMTRFMDNTGNFAQIYGSCGHFYIMEDTPVWHYRKLSMLVGKHKDIKTIPWETRAPLALKLLKMIDTFLGKFSGFHHCDITTQNLGLSESGDVKIIDSDQALFDEQLYSGQCKQHSDCDFMHCQGWCDQYEMKCTRNRTHLNLQQTCQRIFQGHKDNYWVGLLRLPPNNIAEKLKQLLEKCSARWRYLDAKTTSLELQHLLRESLR